MELLNTIIGAIGGGALTALITLPSIIKKAKAEARAADIANIQQAMHSWHLLADERQEELQQRNQRIDQLNTTIDNLYQLNSQWRDKYNSLQETNAQLRVEIEKNKVKICQKPGCADRTPPTGF